MHKGKNDDYTKDKDYKEYQEWKRKNKKQPNGCIFFVVVMIVIILGVIGIIVKKCSGNESTQKALQLEQIHSYTFDVHINNIDSDKNDYKFLQSHFLI